MNNRKLLSILILIFLFINIVLFALNYFIYRDNNKLSSERKARLDVILSENNIELACELPEMQKMKKLYLGEPKKIEKDLVDKVFKDKIRESSYDEGEHRHSDGNETLIFNKIAEKGRVFYNADVPVYKKGRITTKALIEKFTGDFSFDGENYEVFQEDSTDTEKIYFLNETYEGYNIFCNEIVLSIDDEGISEARAIRYPPLEFDAENLDLLMVDAVLYKFMYKNNFEEKVKIVDISIGYYFNDDLLGFSYKFEVDPCYLILLDNGNRYYINAINGEIIA